MCRGRRSANAKERARTHINRVSRPDLTSILTVMPTPMPDSSRLTRHSAEVEMRLMIGDKALPIGQLGPDFLLLRAPIDHAPTAAVLYLSIDGNEHEWDVWLPDGISAASRRVTIARKFS